VSCYILRFVSQLTDQADEAPGCEVDEILRLDLCYITHKCAVVIIVVLNAFINDY
jgi:hypothetical protein